MELADTPVFDELWAEHPHTQLTACGRAVGLPDGQMGNSEVGHLNLGAGAVVRQDLTRIDDAVEDGSFAENEVLRARLCRGAREAGRLHLLGLVSEGGVHASMDHLRALIELAAARGRAGRRCCTRSPTAATRSRLRRRLHGRGRGLAGRRRGSRRSAAATTRWTATSRWERTKLAYDAIVHGRAEHTAADSGEAAVRAAYERGETDEFIKPTLGGGGGRDPRGRRGRLLQLPSRPRAPADSRAARATATCDLTHATTHEYQEDWPYPVAFPPERPTVTLASLLAERGIAQLHVAETEKYAHVTYFFNGGEEDPYAGEERSWSTRRATCRPTTTSPR